MVKSSFKLEKELSKIGYDVVIGVDEAGRGPLAGPVVACAAVYKNCHSRESGNLVWIPGQARNDKLFKLIRDSKLLSEKQREDLYDFICEQFHIGIGICDHKTIDRINILEATYLAMKKAVNDLNKNLRNCHSRAHLSARQESGNLVENKISGSRIKCGMTEKYIILVDGNKKIPNLSMDQRAIVGGDNLVKSISAASIIAKVTRDRMMKKMHEKYPEYNFAKHKGYGTKLHMDMIKKHGPCEIHRRSFRPFA